MDFTDFTAGKNDENRRLDKIIRKMIPESNISSLYSAIRKGLIKVNNKKTDNNYKVIEGDKISIATFLINNNQTEIKKTTDIKITKKIDFETVLSNNFVRIINKPYDISVHGENGLSAIVESIYNSEKHEKSLSFKTGPLHRLDRKTTGLLVFSNNLRGAEWFTKAISEKTISKYYIGICQGTLKNKEIWNDYLIPDETSQSFYKMKIVKPETNIKDCNDTNLASTICTPLAYGKFDNTSLTLCQFQILTGKKHQIRCQSSFHKIPLLGDTAYGGRKIKANQDLYLHAYKLVLNIDNPIELPSEITAPLPHNFENFLKDSLINWNSEIIIN